MKKLKALFNLFALIGAIMATIKYVDERTFILVLVFWLTFVIVQLGIDNSEKALEVIKKKY